MCGGLTGTLRTTQFPNIRRRQSSTAPSRQAQCTYLATSEATSNRTRSSGPLLKKRTDSRTTVGLFVEGSRGTDPLRDDFCAMWQLLGAHCKHNVELHIVGITKGNIVELSDLPKRDAATQLVKGLTQASGGKDPLDVIIQRCHSKTPLDRVVVAFDLWKPNQTLPVADRKTRCPMRPEVAFVLRKLASSERLDPKFKRAAEELLTRYDDRGELKPRTAMGSVEVIFMDPMFEALFVADEMTVRRALKVEDKKPRDWPKFKTHVREIDKAVIDPAIQSVVGWKHPYLNAKARWGHAIVKAALPGAAIWKHAIAQRLCKLLGA